MISIVEINTQPQANTLGATTFALVRNLSGSNYPVLAAASGFASTRKQSYWITVSWNVLIDTLLVLICQQPTQKMCIPSPIVTVPVLQEAIHPLSSQPAKATFQDDHDTLAQQRLP
jgi:hypothetical protein